MQTINLKTTLYTLLASTGRTVYEYTRVPKDATFPYVTYNLTTSTESDRDAITDVDLTLEIDILDYSENKDSTVIETILDEINSLINRKEVIGSEFYFRIERNSILQMLPTANEFTMRRQIACTLNYMERG